LQRLLFVASALILASSASAQTLSMDGACPGAVDINLSGFTPGATAVFLAGFSGEGSDVIGVGACAGTVTGLAGVRFLTRVTADGAGAAAFSPTIGESRCDTPIQVLDTATCTLSNVTTANSGGPIGETCRDVAGITWCFHPSECGIACADTCAANGLAPMADRVAWFEAQNTIEECQPIADAFGAFEPVDINGWSYGCMNDGHGSDHTGLDASVNTSVPWLCSSSAGCPDSIIDNMDQLGVPCGPDASRKTVCACE
jgi:hypothetical protein